MFYSNAAYEYVRKIIPGLPHPETVRKWFRKFDFNPGISANIISSVKDHVFKLKNENKKIVFGLQADEIHIKKCTETDGKSTYGYVDLGTGITDDSNEATSALVYMLVSLNSHSKTPIAYFFINGLGAQERANITLEILKVLQDNGIEVRSFTFDGTGVNISTAECLGADFNDINKAVFIKHPVSGQKIYIILDACHMLKLIRNTLGDFLLADNENGVIDWKFLNNLVILQEKEKLHCATKIRRRHINFKREKMKVPLAAQTISMSNHDALTFLEKDLKLTEFQGAGPTANYCKQFNDMFDFLNVKTHFGSKTSTRRSITKDNINEWKLKVANWKNYITGLKVIEKNDYEFLEKQEKKQSNDTKTTVAKSNATIVNNFFDPNSMNKRKEEYKEPNKVEKKVGPETGKCILKSNRKTGFFGFIVTMNSSLALAEELLDEKVVEYFLTYKLSQDHLETFFSVIRRMGGYNNNPSCKEFKSAYKKVVTHVHSLVSTSANCKLQDDTELLHTKNYSESYSESNINNNNEDNDIEKLINYIDHDYNSDSKICWSEYKEAVVSYIAGFISKSITEDLSRSHDCEFCKEALISDDEPCMLQIRKDRGTERQFLTTPSKDVISLCKLAEKIFLSIPNVLKINNSILKLSILTKNQLPKNIFSNLVVIDDTIIDYNIENSHKFNLIDKILNKYFTLRLYHEAKSNQDKTDRIRTYLSRSIIYMGQ